MEVPIKVKEFDASITEMVPASPGGLGVYVKFKEPGKIKGLKTVFVKVLAKDYSKEELIEGVSKAAERRLEKHLIEAEEERLEAEIEKKRMNSWCLKELIKQLNAKLGLE